MGGEHCGFLPIVEQMLLPEVPRLLRGSRAPWIKIGVEIIPNSRFVLNRYHLKRALHAACNRYPSSHWRTLKEALKKLDIPKLVETLMTCGREGVCSYETVRTTIDYLLFRLAFEIVFIVYPFWI